jgi:hypothetical protein
LSRKNEDELVIALAPAARYAREKFSAAGGFEPFDDLVPAFADNRQPMVMVPAADRARITNVMQQLAAFIFSRKKGTPRTRVRLERFGTRRG